MNRLCKFFTCSLFFLFVQQYAIAQLGITGGLHASTMVFSQGEEYEIVDPLMGFNTAVFYEIPVSKALSIRPQLGYSTNGFEIGITGEALVTTLQTQVNSIDAGLIAKLNADLGGIGLFLTFGPLYRYAVNGKVTTESVFAGNRESASTAIDFEEDEMKRQDIVAALGVGISFPIRTAQFFIDATYRYGISNVNADPTSSIKAQNAGVGLNGGLIFKIGK